MKGSRRFNIQLIGIFLRDRENGRKENNKNNQEAISEPGGGGCQVQEAARTPALRVSSSPKEPPCDISEPQGQETGSKASQRKQRAR